MTTCQVSPDTLEAAAFAHRLAIEIDSDNDRAHLTVAGIRFWCQLDLAAVAA